MNEARFGSRRGSSSTVGGCDAGWHSRILALQYILRHSFRHRDRGTGRGLPRMWLAWIFLSVCVCVRSVSVCGWQQRPPGLHQFLSLPVGAKRVALKQAANATPARAGRPGCESSCSRCVQVWAGCCSGSFPQVRRPRSQWVGRVLHFKVCTHTVSCLFARVSEGVCQQFPGMNMFTSSARGCAQHVKCFLHISQGQTWPFLSCLVHARS